MREFKGFDEVLDGGEGFLVMWECELEEFLGHGFLDNFMVDILMGD